MMEIIHFACSNAIYNMNFILYFSCLALKIENFRRKIFDIFLIFAQNIDCGYTLEPPTGEAVLTSTHNLCFGAKIRKNRYTPAYPSFAI